MFHFRWKKQKKSTNDINIDIVSIGDGELIELSKVSDDVFKNQMLGKTIAFEFAEDTVSICSPTSGVLSVVFPTCHAYGITRDDGIEVLIHIGIDTVQSNGAGFFPGYFKQDDRVCAGDVLTKVNFKMLKEKYEMPVFLIITNDQEKEIEFIQPTHVTLGESLLKKPIR